MSEDANDPRKRLRPVLAACAVAACGLAVTAAAAIAYSADALAEASRAATVRYALLLALGLGLALALGAIVALALGPLRRLREHDLEQAQWRERCEDLLRALPEGACLIDADFIIREPVSPSLFGLLQRKLWPGMDLVEALRPMLAADTVDALRVHLRQCFAARAGARPATRNPLAEMVLPGPPSRALQLGFRFEPVRHGERVVYLLVLVGDIGERLRVSRELAGARLRLRAQLDGLLRACGRDGLRIRSGLSHAEAALERTRVRLARLRLASGAQERDASLRSLLEEARTIKREAVEVELELLETPAHHFELDLLEAIEAAATADEGGRLAAHVEMLAERIATVREFVVGLDARMGGVRRDEREGGAVAAVPAKAGREAILPTPACVSARVPGSALPASAPATPAVPATLRRDSEAAPAPVRPALPLSGVATPSAAQPPSREPAQDFVARLRQRPDEANPLPADASRSATHDETAARAASNGANPRSPAAAVTTPAPTPTRTPTLAPTPTPTPTPIPTQAQTQTQTQIQQTPAPAPARASTLPPAAPALIAQRRIETPAPVAVSPPPPPQAGAPAPSVPLPAGTAPLPAQTPNAVPAARQPTARAPIPSPPDRSENPETQPAAAQSGPARVALRHVEFLAPSSQAAAPAQATDPAMERGAEPTATIAAVAAHGLASSVPRGTDSIARESSGTVAVSVSDYDPLALVPLLALSGDSPAALPADKAAFVDWAALARRLAGEQGKAVRVEALLDPFAQLSPAQAAMIRDVGMELVANAVLHGIESMSMRRRVGKDPVGAVRLSLSRDERGGWLFCARDDGRGVNLVRVRAALVSGAGYTPAQAAKLSEREAIMKVFEPGVTTAPQAGGARGRGLGLPNAVERLRGLRARVSLVTVPGRSTEVRIVWPVE